MGTNGGESNVLLAKGPCVADWTKLAESCRRPNKMTAAVQFTFVFHGITGRVRAILEIFGRRRWGAYAHLSCFVFARIRSFCSLAVLVCCCQLAPRDALVSKWLYLFLNIIWKHKRTRICKLYLALVCRRWPIVREAF